MISILQGDWVERLRELPDCSVHCCVTSPPYWGLRDYGMPGQLGLEKSPEEYVSKLVKGFMEVRRVLRDDGSLWINLGDSYASKGGSFNPNDWDSKQSTNRGSAEQVRRPPNGLKPKDLVGIPWRVAFALQADGWYLRSDIIWHKPNPMPESVTDRPTKSHEYIFLLTKSERYFYDAEAIKDPVTGGAHPRANGAHSRMVLEKAAGRESSKPNPSRSHIPGVCPKSAASGSGIKSNESFHSAVVDLVSSRNKRSVWTVATSPYSDAHFATFPPDLIEPCILAGTSAKGCCQKCGAPSERVMEKFSGYEGARRNDDLSRLGTSRGTGWKSGSQLAGLPPPKTLGWQLTCDCDESQLVPCNVLDPFAGSGTTGKVALELGRNAVLIELNPEYVKLIHNRTNITPGLKLA